MNRPIVVITGASSGFGLLASAALAKEGYQVIATMRNIRNCDALLNAAREAKAEASIDIVPLDITDETSIKEAADYVIERYGSVDLLINNAGVAVGGFVEEIPSAEWERQFSTNVLGLIAVTRAFLPHMRKQRKGTIINMSSISGQIGFPGLAPYAASKHAVEGFSEALRLEMLPHNVYVCMIEPGSYKTDIWKKSRGQISLRADSPYAEQMQALNEQVDRIIEQAPSPDEVIERILQIARHPAPKLRYPVGRNMRTTLFLKHLLPWSWLEKLILRQLRLRS
ncbi:SDR family oxidoreductase [Brevibacillus migulae]|uniref:SDR family oxidoreductase n=1 Tax=Brevibacillus migulae TaxID=1644114 RepID=UPI00106E5C37|nr:SDR family oxidoreductase [Brevibacillus migulae]